MENVTRVEWSVRRVFKDVRPLFYLETPSTSSFEHLSDVPDYVGKIIPYMYGLVVLEVLVRWMQGKPAVRVNSTITSLATGLMTSLVKVLVSTIDIGIYVWVYSHLRVVDLPWNWSFTWWLAFFGIDFIYYWFHRMAHEVNLVWASHQVHHSSEDFTLSIALRQSAFQRFFALLVYLPFALILPPSVYFAHLQLNFLWLWVHTEVIDTLGPLEWVLVTPSHHRVHHGRNPYCIDSNYGGVLIIWDKMFGTFQPEKREEKVIYGLVHPLQSFDPFWVQVHHLKYLWTTFWEMEGVGNKLSFLLKGPGWSPGKPRLGSPEDIPEVSPDEKPYGKAVPAWLNVYVIVHFISMIIFAGKLQEAQDYLHPLLTIALTAYIILSLVNFGLMFDHNPHCVLIEVARLVALLTVDLALTHYSILSVPILPQPAIVLIRGLVLVSLTVWLMKLGSMQSSKLDTSKQD